MSAIADTVYHPAACQPHPVHGAFVHAPAVGFGCSAMLIAYAMYLVWFVAPPDYQQGETVKINYIHVPAAWLSMMGYSIVAMSSFGLLVFRHPLADVSAKAAAPLGAAFTLIALVTGSLWGKPMWGTYWVWDARLTSGVAAVLPLPGPHRAALNRSKTKRLPESSPLFWRSSASRSCP